MTLTVNGRKVDDGRIVSPGKFEGQMAYMEDAYERFLDGFYDESRDIIRVTLAGNHNVRFIIDDMGFVREV